VDDSVDAIIILGKTLEYNAGRLPLPEQPGEEELKNREDRFIYLVHHGPLTDLPNRRLLMDRVGQAIK